MIATDFFFASSLMLACFADFCVFAPLRPCAKNFLELNVSRKEAKARKDATERGSERHACPSFASLIDCRLADTGLGSQD